MNFTFHDKRISGILTVVPAHEGAFLDDMKNFNFPEARSRKLMEVMGYDKRRLVEGEVCVSDLSVCGLRHLFEKGLLNRDDIDALLVVTTTPDHFTPPTSSIIHGRLELKQDMLCLDINQACAGFVIGLIQAFSLLEQENVRRVVLVNCDVLSRKVSPKDRNIYPLIGDAAGITVVERDVEESVIYASAKTDGKRSNSLIIPAGGLRNPSTQETARLEDAGDGNLRAKDHLHMDGTAIFNFVQLEVPPLIESLLDTAGLTGSEIDYFLCHQPNRFMLQKLADKMRIPHARMPNNVVEHFGNSGGATIPTAITHNLSDKLKDGHCRICFAGFGGGLTWAAMLLKLGALSFCEMVEYP